MTLKNLKYVNDLGGIQATHSVTEVDQYLSPGSILHDVAVSGFFGQIIPYEPEADPAEPPTFATVDEALADLSAHIDALLTGLVKGAGDMERHSWFAREAVARAYLAGEDLGDTSLLHAEAAVTGEEIDQLADRIMEASEAYHASASTLTGVRRKARHTLIAASNAYAYDGIITAAKEEADALFAAHPQN